MLGNTVLRRVVQRQVRQLSMFENKNTIKEVRNKFYTNNTAGADHPTYLKEPGDKIVTAVAAGGILIGLTVIGRGLYSMANGVNKVSP
jgi:hypothetical protein